MKRTLIIKNVDLDKLEDQRRTLNDILRDEEASIVLSGEWYDTLEELARMLDRWSDYRTERS